LALDYTLFINAVVEPSAAARALIPDAPLRDCRPDLMRASLDAVSLSLRAVPEDYAPPLVVDETLGLRTRLILSFRLDKERQREARRTTIRIVDRALRTWAADAALLFNHERVLLLRRAGNLKLNVVAAWWKDSSNLELIRAPYTMEELPDVV